MKSNILHVLVILFFFLKVDAINSQTVYVVTGKQKIYKLNQDKTFSFIIKVGTTLGDIAISETGDIYGTAFSKKGIVKVDLNDGSYTTMPNTENVSSNSLVYVGNGDLYFINERALSKYNINTNVLEVVSNFNLSTPGDVSLFKGNIIFPNFVSLGAGKPSYSRIMSYNINSGSLREVACLKDKIEVYGLSNSFNTCEDNTIVFSTSKNTFYIIDIEDGTITDFKIDASNFEGSVVYGLASDNEYLASSCNKELKKVSCLNALSVEEFSVSTSIFPNPVEEVLNIKSTLTIDLIEFYDTRGKLIKQLNNPNDEVEMNDLKSGIYFLKFYSNTLVKVVKIVKK